MDDTTLAVLKADVEDRCRDIGHICDRIGALDELRRFRHLFRHAYSANLAPAKVAELAEQCGPSWTQFQQEKDNFLEQLAP